MTQVGGQYVFLRAVKSYWEVCYLDLVRLVPVVLLRSVVVWCVMISCFLELDLPLTCLPVDPTVPPCPAGRCRCSSCVS